MKKNETIYWEKNSFSNPKVEGFMVCINRKRAWKYLGILEEEKERKKKKEGSTGARGRRPPAAGKKKECAGEGYFVFFKQILNMWNSMFTL